MTLRPNKKNISEIVKKKINNKEAAIVNFKIDFNDKSFHITDPD
jgi:hypothetical protein